MIYVIIKFCIYQILDHSISSVQLAPHSPIGHKMWSSNGIRDSIHSRGRRQWEAWAWWMRKRTPWRRQTGPKLQRCIPDRRRIFENSLEKTNRWNATSSLSLVATIVATIRIWGRAVVDPVEACHQNQVEADAKKGKGLPLKRFRLLRFHFWQ